MANDMAARQPAASRLARLRRPVHHHGAAPDRAACLDVRLHLNTAHIAAALTYTLVSRPRCCSPGAEARGRARRQPGWPGARRSCSPRSRASASSCAIFSVGHIGTALPVLLTWLLLDRPGAMVTVPRWLRSRRAARRGAAADPLVLVIAIFPLLLCCLPRIVPASRSVRRRRRSRAAAAAGARPLARGIAGRRRRDRLPDAWVAGQLLANSGGFVQQPVPYAHRRDPHLVLARPGRGARPARDVRRLLVPGQRDQLPQAHSEGLPRAGRPSGPGPGDRADAPGRRGARGLGRVRDRPPLLPQGRRLREPAAARGDRRQPRGLHPEHDRQRDRAERARDRPRSCRSPPCSPAAC